MPKFKTYDCKLRLEGSVLNEVPKENLTAADIEMYRALHGSDAIVDIKETGAVTRADAAERNRVRDFFMNPVLDAPPRLRAKQEMFRNMFGHDSLPMPVGLATAGDEIEDEPEVVEQPEPIKRTRATRAAPEAAFTE